MDKDLDDVLGVFEPLNCVGDIRESDREDLLLIDEVRGLVKKLKSCTKSLLLQRI